MKKPSRSQALACLVSMFPFAAFVVLLSLPAPVMAQGQAGTPAGDIVWLTELTSETCSDDARRTVATNARGSIESSVARAETSIRPPSPVAGLGCIGPLLQSPIDIFSSALGGLSGIFQVSPAGGFGFGLDLNTAICKFAEEKIGELSVGPVGSLKDIQSRSQREIAAITQFSDGFSFNVGQQQVQVPAAPQPATTSTGGAFQPSPGQGGTPSATQQQLNTIIRQIQSRTGSGQSP
ncbi:MAG: hypothetical protein F4213_03210 [Boseongicola sp. SB0677_bin_26]|nr:hypothetical protein [Boseongicola sp. SB0665_bin_10]MYG25023.1 hypothetical protein [Boseongicola sp. SB0677_bin_26]